MRTWRILKEVPSYQKERFRGTLNNVEFVTINVPNVKKKYLKSIASSYFVHFYHYKFSFSLSIFLTAFIKNNKKNASPNRKLTTSLEISKNC